MMLEIFSLKGKVALFTGGSRGLGKAMAIGLAKAGADVAVVGRKADQDVIDQIEAQGVRGKFYEYDLSNIDGIAALVSEVKKDFGHIDILVNNAGVQSRHKAVEFPKADWDFVLNVNMSAVFFLCQEVGRLMLAQGKGKIINIASLLSFQGGLTVPAYAASKGAVAQFTKSLSNEWASQGINVNCIAPGYMATEMNTALIADATRSRQIMERIPAGRWGKPEDMVGAAVYLASDASDYVNGSTITVDGGWMGR
jgi:2-dehydro-3-deoxy-D-gluconate 5-dehydrogenase